MCQVPIVLGGPGVVVQIDKSLFSHQVKAHRGRPPTHEVWVFGTVDTSYKPALGYMQIVNRRDSATLLPIIQASVAPGSIVHSDELSAYRQIQSQTGLTHRTVNHSLHFVSPTGVHTNNVESYWNRAKMKIKAMRGCTRDKLSSYLDEFKLCGKKDMARLQQTASITCSVTLPSTVLLTGSFDCRIKQNVDKRCTVSMIYHIHVYNYNMHHIIDIIIIILT